MRTKTKHLIGYWVVFIIVAYLLLASSCARKQQMWTAVWTPSVKVNTYGDTIRADGYMLVLIEETGQRELWTGKDTTCTFKFDGKPCVGVYAFRVLNQDTLYSDMSKVVCAE